MKLSGMHQGRLRNWAGRGTRSEELPIKMVTTSWEKKTGKVIVGAEAEIRDI